jgi:hypothetical protein
MAQMLKVRQLSNGLALIQGFSMPGLIQVEWQQLALDSE